MGSTVRLDNINEIVDFCLNEIALEGLEGLLIHSLFLFLGERWGGRLKFKIQSK